MKSINSASDKEIKIMLVSVFLLIGVDIGSIDEKKEQHMLNYIRDRLGSFSKNDFIIAFLLGMRGELDYDIDYYTKIKNFNTLYLERVMSSFRRYRYKILQNAKLNIEIEKTVELSEAEKQELIKKYTIQLWQRYITNLDKLMFKGTFSSYDYLDKLGLIQLSTEKKQEYTKEAEKLIKNELMKTRGRCGIFEVGKINNLTEVIEQFSERKHDFKNRIKNQAKELALKNYFENCKEIDVDLIEVINQK